MNSINITVFLNDVDSKYVDSQWKIKKSNVIIEEGMDIYIRVKSIEDNEIKGKLDKESMRNQMTPDEHYETIHEYIERKVTKHQK